MGVRSCLEKNLAVTPVSLPKGLRETAQPPEAACLEQSHLQARLCTEQRTRMNPEGAACSGGCPLPESGNSRNGAGR